MYISLLKFLVTVPRNTIKNFSLGLQSQVQESQALILCLESQLSEEEVQWGIGSLRTAPVLHQKWMFSAIKYSTT